LKNNKVRIIVNSSTNKFMNFLVYNKINYSNLIKGDEIYILDIDYKDIDKFKRYDYIIDKYYGIKGIVNYLKYNNSFIFGIACGLFILYLLCNTIFEVKINSDNEDLVNKINASLYENNIVKYKKKISFNEIQKIKEKILEENKENLEWIEIIEDGCNYIVEVTQRIKGSTKDDNKSPSNIVASKDGLIKHISLINGVKIKDVNDYVKKGDVIISGEIFHGEKLVNTTNAKGFVYAEVWYTTTVTIPFKYKEYVDTGKKVNRYYLKFNDKEMTIVGKYNNESSMSNKILVLNKPYLPFDIYKEEIKIYKYKTFLVDENDAYNIAIEKADYNVNKTLDSDEYIIDKKVLKKVVNSSKMILEVFYKVYENISDTSIIEEVSND